MIYINWMALWNIYRIFGITAFILGWLLRTVGRARKSKFVKRVGNILIIITIPLIVLALLEAIGVNDKYPVLNFRLYNIMDKNINKY